MSDLIDTPREGHPVKPAFSLLDRETLSDYVAEWTAQVGAGKEVVLPGTKSAVIFRIGKEWVALFTGLFHEVIEQSAIRTLPGRRGGVVRGLINVRGELLLCIALEVVLGIENAAERSPKDRLLIFGRGRDRFAVQANEVFGVHRYNPKDLSPTPPTLRKTSSESYTDGILHWQGTTVACLNEDLLLKALTRGLS
jgi:chemotaxis-related protein WspD